MKIKTITYQKTFAIAPFLNEKIGIEIEVDDDISSDNAMKVAKAKVEIWHREMNPQLFNGSQPLPSGEIPITQVEKNLSPEAKLIADIMTVTDMKVLESYKLLIAKKSEALQAAYEIQVKKLSK